MGTSSFAALAGMGMFAMLLMIVGSILMGALILCLSFRLVVGYMPSYLRSIGVILATFVAVLLASVVLGMIPHGLSSFLSLLADFLVGAAVINHLLLAQDGSQVGYGKACLVQLVYMVIGFALLLVLGLIMAMVFGVAMFAMH